ncbi:protein-glutamate methylesterase/protein-glutamine glutaminase [Hathewaya limosa]|uniref:Protein-glutamate methylesterase/protein-glutamine glutaminase n=1 Tax=Hathewaya limosa TaxID=1536 RepID=A0ABU0JTH3_HATLI|nr:chemotaxis response regulator protein-glutamate methylesterase [Hathewaya limosa]MDQ0479217.1 two-component system chemotaxis response regulator CheB [Hathewaya limosa]
MNKIKVLVVDDSALMRKIISDMINQQSDMEVINTARNGDDLFEKLDKAPDVITLDVEMPKVDGIEALKILKKCNINIPVIMLSSLTKKGAETTLECLELGAFDFVAKPSGSISLDIEKVKENLVEKIRAAYGRRKFLANRAIRNTKSPFEKTYNKSSEIINSREKISRNKETLRERETLFKHNTMSTTMHKEYKMEHVEHKENLINNHIEGSRLNRRVIDNKKIDAVVIGASTGGPKALYEVITKLPELNVPVFVVQHMPVGFTKVFADRLDKNSVLKVVEAEDKMEVSRNTVYVAKGGYHMEIWNDKKIHLNTEPAIWGVRPAVDKLFISASKVYRQNILSVVLTGMGKDGAEGTVAIKDGGGVTFSEDERTCTIYGMPKAAFNTGKVDEVIPLNEVVSRITEVVLRRGA